MNEDLIKKIMEEQFEVLLSTYSRCLEMITKIVSTQILANQESLSSP